MGKQIQSILRFYKIELYKEKIYIIIAGHEKVVGGKSTKILQGTCIYQAIHETKIIHDKDYEVPEHDLLEGNIDDIISYVLEDCISVCLEKVQPSESNDHLRFFTLQQTKKLNNLIKLIIFNINEHKSKLEFLEDLNKAISNDFIILPNNWTAAKISNLVVDYEKGT